MSVILLVEIQAKQLNEQEKSQFQQVCSYSQILLEALVARKVALQIQKDFCNFNLKMIIYITFPFHLTVKYFLKVDGTLTSIG